MFCSIVSLAFDIWQLLSQMPSSPVASFRCKPASSLPQLPTHQLASSGAEGVDLGKLVAIQSSGQGPINLSQPRVTSGCFPETSGKYPSLSHCTGSAVWGGRRVGDRGL